MPTDTKAAPTSKQMLTVIEQLQSERAELDKQHQVSAAKLEQQIADAQSKQQQLADAEAKAQREADMTASFKKLRDEVVPRLNVAAAEYARLLAEFNELLPNTRSKRSSMGGYSGEVTTYQKALDAASRLPTAIVSDDQSKVFLLCGTASGHPGCDRHSFDALNAAIQSGDAVTVTRLMEEANEAT